MEIRDRYRDYIPVYTDGSRAKVGVPNNDFKHYINQYIFSC